MSMLLLRGRLLSFNRAPLSIDDTASYLYIEDGGLLMSEGKIAAIGDYADIKAQAPEGTEALPVNPLAVPSSTSRVGLPRLSKISRPRTATISVMWCHPP